MLQIQSFGGAVVHAFHVLLRYRPSEMVIVQEESLHPSQEGGYIPRDEVMAQVHDGSLAAVGLEGGVHLD